jgi:hypothetical protein
MLRRTLDGAEMLGRVVIAAVIIVVVPGCLASNSPG